MLSATWPGSQRRVSHPNNKLFCFQIFGWISGMSKIMSDINKISLIGRWTILSAFTVPAIYSFILFFFPSCSIIEKRKKKTSHIFLFSTLRIQLTCSIKLYWNCHCTNPTGALYQCSGTHCGRLNGPYSVSKEVGGSDRAGGRLKHVVWVNTSNTINKSCWICPALQVILMIILREGCKNLLVAWKLNTV